MKNVVVGTVYGRVIQADGITGDIDLSGPRLNAEPEPERLPSVRDLPHYGQEPGLKWWQRGKKRDGADPGPDGEAIADALQGAFEPKEALTLLNLLQALHGMDQEARDRAPMSMRVAFQDKAGTLIAATGQWPGQWRPDAVEAAKKIISGL